MLYQLIFLLHLLLLLLQHLSKLSDDLFHGLLRRPLRHAGHVQQKLIRLLLVRIQLLDSRRQFSQRGARALHLFLSAHLRLHDSLIGLALHLGNLLLVLLAGATSLATLGGLIAAALALAALDGPAPGVTAPTRTTPSSAAP